MPNKAMHPRYKPAGEARSMNIQHQLARPLLLLLLLSLLPITACTRNLVPTPNLYQLGDNPYQQTPEAMQFSGVDVIFATDRLPTDNTQPARAYGYKRSNTLSVGIARVGFGSDSTWDQLVDVSTGASKRKLPLRILSAEEIFEFPPTAGYSINQPEFAEHSAQSQQALNILVSDYLQRSGGDTAFVFVHGYNNRFADSLYPIAQIWHYLGRTGVPIAYSWPAGRGTLRGYTYDRESGEFTNYHLKMFLRSLAASPSIKTIHVIGHSRGTDVLTTALRELAIEAGCNDQKLSDTIKLGHLILAAPDMDFQVMVQRLGAESLHLQPLKTTVYLNPEDKALGLASLLFLSEKRFGRVSPEDLTPQQIQSVLHYRDRVGYIDARVKSGFIGHSYFYANPAVLSDLILLLRDNAWVDDPRRPLEATEQGMWILRDNYPKYPQPTAHNQP